MTRYHSLVLLIVVTSGLAWFLCAGTATGKSSGQLENETPRFSRDVMAVLSKAGCNMGACHGNQNGKGGFKLSLRGEDPAFDYESIVRLDGGRRVDRLTPTRSLMLRKPALRLAHEGGRRFRSDSWEYRTLEAWLQRGALPPRADAPRLVRLDVFPNDKVLLEPNWQIQLRAVAHFSDGSTQDVTRQAVYESSDLIVQVDPNGRARAKRAGEATVTVRYLHLQRPVRLAFVPGRTDFVWRPPSPNNPIDSYVLAHLQPLRINLAEQTDDATFIRRAYLDAVGIPPTAAQARRFVDDRRPDKRTRLIDQLLGRPEFSDYWALRWSDVLRNEEKVLDPRGVEQFYGWIRQSMASAKPLNQFVAELIQGRGSTYDHPPANYYRANRDPSTRGETTARLFLGIRLQCAQCHNHPFDRWTQSDYYSWAALFARIDYKIVENKRTDKLDKNEFRGEQIVLFKADGEVRNPRTGKNAAPKFLDDAPTVSHPGESRLASLANWLTAADNRQFARAQANRIWYHVMGRGLVEPIDDFRLTNPASNEPLLDLLADELQRSGFDLRHLVRLIMNSRVYQASATTGEPSEMGDRNFASATVRRLPAEVLLDAQCHVLDSPASFVGYPTGLRAGQLAGVRKVRRRSKPPAEGDRFLATFGKPERLLACECERSDETTLAQAFVLMSGEGLQRRLTQPNNRLDQLLQRHEEDRPIVQDLYWWTLGRSATEAELQSGERLLQTAASRREGLQDLAWALLNCKEFVFRH